MIVGESDGIRTHGHRGHNPVLYQLSYALHMRFHSIGTSGGCQAIEHFPEIPSHPGATPLTAALSVRRPSLTRVSCRVADPCAPCSALI